MKYFIFTFLFWGLTSCNSGQIEDLEYQLQTLQSEVDDLQTELADCNSDLEEAQEKISNLEVHSNNLDDELSSLKREIDDFHWQDWESNAFDVEWRFRNVRNSFEELQAEF